MMIKPARTDIRLYDKIDSLRVWLIHTSSQAVLFAALSSSLLFSIFFFLLSQLLFYSLAEFNYYLFYFNYTESLLDLCLHVNTQNIKSRQSVYFLLLFAVLNEPRHEKTGFCICENKAADQLCGNRTADQRLCFRYMDSTIPLLPKSEMSCL